MSGTEGSYQDAHLLVAAVRVLADRKNGPPSVEEVSELVGRSREWGHMMVRRLEPLGILATGRDPFSIKLFVGDHLKIEELPRETATENALAGELARFQQERQDKEKKVAAVVAEQKQKQADLFARLEAELKKKTGQG